MKLRSNYLWMAAVVLLVTACVPSKKFKEVQEQSAQMQARNAQLAGTIDLLNRQVSDLTTQNQSMTSEFASYKNKCEATEQAYREVSNVLEREAKTMQLVQDKLEHAMADFSSRGVEVYSRQGFVHVSLSDELMYKSGSAELGENGKKALASLASVINDYPNLKVIIVGNTDDVKFKKGIDNWTLSTERANGVVRVLRDDYNVDPSRLTAGGKAKYNPVADNSTPEGRAKNRRTDIILNPDIESIWEMARNEQ